MNFQFENTYTEIFTEPDNTIFSDGSIDPLGLQMIWTSLGNRVFQNRLNTVSTNIHFYTINLLHHAVICELEEKHIDKIVNLTGKAPYDNRNDLYDGIIIFLECLMAHGLLQQSNADAASELIIPGLSKLKGILLNKRSEKIATSLPVDKRDGILVRQNLLGIHGRHKGPFEQMGLFAKYEYYTNKPLWKQIRNLFSTGEWKNLFESLQTLTVKYVINARIVAGKPVRVKLTDVLNDSLKQQYQVTLTNEHFKSNRFLLFWEEQLGFNDAATTAGSAYKEIQTTQGDLLYQDVWMKLGSKSEKTDVQAICAIEPFLSSIQKLMDRLLQRGTSDLDDALLKTVRLQLLNPEIDLQKINTFITDDAFNAVAQKRMTDLLTMFADCRNPVDEKRFILQLIAYHQSIMKQRNNLPWLSISANGSITQHRSFYYTEERVADMETYQWVNDYYLSTVASLYHGLYL